VTGDWDGFGNTRSASTGLAREGCSTRMGWEKRGGGGEGGGGGCVNACSSAAQGSQVSIRRRILETCVVGVWTT